MLAGGAKSQDVPANVLQYCYSAPEPDQDRRDREIGYLILAALVVLVPLAMATGQVPVFYY